MVWTKFSGKRILGRVCHWLVMKQSSFFKAQKSVFWDRVLCLGRVLQHPDSNEAWNNRVNDAINGESTELESNIFPEFTTLQLCNNINDLLSNLGQTPESFTGRILFMSMFNDIFVTEKATKMNAWQMPEWWKHLRDDLVFDNGHLLDQVPKRSGVLPRIVLKEPGDDIADEMLLEFAESGHPTFRATTPLSRGQIKSKRHGKLSIHFAADDFTIDTIFRIVLSNNQLSVYGAVAALCEEFENHRDGSNLRFWWGNQLFSVKLKQKSLCRMKTPWIIKFNGNITFNELNRFHQKIKWICVLLKLDNISWPKKLVTKNNFVQWLVANTLFLEMIRLQKQKDGIKETWELGLHWKSRPVFNTSNMELKFEFGLWIKIILNLGSENHMERSNMWSIQSKTI